jgi:uncharacterized protein YndB with AHSA1/START domain
MKITVETTVHARAQEVWRVWTTPQDILDNFAMHVELLAD